MALQDDDKKFIKDTVSEEISSELDKRDIGKSSEDVYKKNQENIEDRLNYLAERTLAGESTMAEKFELMKTAMKEAIPEDLKNVTAAVGQTFGKGGKQLAKGLSDLTGTVAKLTPLTAMLWKSRHIIGGVLGGVGNIIGGVGKLGWGVVKGVGGAAGSMLNAVANFGIKKVSPKLLGDIQPQKDTKGKITNPLGENVEETEQEESSLTNLFNSLEPSTGPAGLQQGQQMMQQKSQMEKQIAEIHSKVVGGKKDEIKNTKTMLKGIQGMDKAMKAINGIMTAMKAKQLLIVAGIIAGVAAIIGLAKWFKTTNLFKAVVKKNPESGKNRTDNVIDAGNVSGLNVDSRMKMMDMKHKLGTDTKIESSKEFNLWDWAKGPMASRQIAKDFNLSGATSDLLGESTHLAHGGLVGNVKSIKNKGNTKIAFPVAVKMLDIRFDESKDMGASALIEKAEVTAGMKERVRYATGSSERLIITNIVEVLIPKKTVVKPNTTLFIVGENYQIIGNLAAFLRGEKYEDYTNKNQADSSTIDKNYKEQAKDKKFQDALVKSEQDYTKQAAFQEALEETMPGLSTAGKVMDNLLDIQTEENAGKKDYYKSRDPKAKDKYNDNPPNIETVPGDNAGGPSVNEQNNNKLNNDINNTTKPQNKGTTPTQNKQGGSNNGGNTVVMANPQQGSQVANPAIVNMSSYEHMTPGRGNVNVGGR